MRNYTEIKVNGEEMMADHGNKLEVVSTRPYKGKIGSDGKVILPPGTIATLKFLEDLTPPVIDKETGVELDNDVGLNIDVTLPGVPWPMPFKKGDIVSLFKFDAEHSYFIEYNYILRFREIRAWKEEDK